MLRSEDGKSILDCLNRKADIYTSPTIQNEMLEVNMPIRFSADRLSSFSFKHKLKLRFTVWNHSNVQVHILRVFM